MFLAKNQRFFTWLVLSALSIILLCQTDSYHRAAWYSSSNAVVGGIYDMRSEFTSYFSLKSTNEDLLERIGVLETENLHLREQLLGYADSLYMSEKKDSFGYSYRIAHVVGNTINQAENYITLDMGRADGIEPDLGIADENGVVGITASVSEHYTLVISLLNPKFRLSAMLTSYKHITQGSQGSLVWPGGNPQIAYLEDLPRNVIYEIGDTVVTTGYTAAFPKGVPVGTVADAIELKNTGDFLTLKVKLFVNFDRLNNVHIIRNSNKEEREVLLKTGTDNNNGKS